jgi:hypothetical protein
MTTSLPVARLRVRPARTGTFYVVTRMDVSGRLAARSPLRLLGWEPGCSVVLRIADGCVVVSRSDSGVTVAGQGCLRLPASVRRVFALGAGDQVLMAVDPRNDMVVLYPASMLDSALSPRLRDVVVG